MIKKLHDTKYFKVDEFLRSETADKLGINNTPTDETIIDNINYSLTRLNEIRESYGKPIIISSGYRCQALNEAVGGVKDSKHLYGLAVDLKWDPQLLEFITDNMQFDKLIREKAAKTRWIHIQFRRDRETERNLIYSISK
jgi:hypothetical protein